MLNFAMVLMILAGVFGLPAVFCSGACSGMGHVAEEAAKAQGESGSAAIFHLFFYLAIVASIGSIVMGALVKRLKKGLSGALCFIFCAIFVALLLQLNFWGLPSAFMLLISGIMIFVAPAEQFKDVTKVKVTE